MTDMPWALQHPRGLASRRDDNLREVRLCDIERAKSQECTVVK